MSKLEPISIPDSGGEVDERGAFHARQMAHALENRLIGEHGNRSRRVPCVFRDRHLGEAGGVRGHGGERGDVRGVKSQARLLQVPEGAEQQAGSHQQQRGEGDFAGHQPAAELSAHGARTDAARRRLQRSLRIGARDQQRRQAARKAPW